MLPKKLKDEKGEHNMPKLILVTTGTSALFEHSNWKEGFSGRSWWKVEELSKYLEQEAINDESEEYDHQKQQVLKALTENLKIYYRNKVGLNTLSAELASLLAMQERVDIGKIEDEDKIVLLCSDTIDGKLCAEVNEKIMKNEMVADGKIVKAKWNVISLKVDHLTVIPTSARNNLAKKFMDYCLSDLQKKVRTSLEEFQRQFGKENSKIFFNITGGYKATIPFITLLVINYEMIITYLYEQSDQLIVLNHKYFKYRIDKPEKDLTPDEGEKAL